MIKRLLTIGFIFSMTIWGVGFAQAAPGTDFNVSVIGIFECQDFVDNDGDTLIDLADPGCSSQTDNQEGDIIIGPGGGGGGGGGGGSISPPSSDIKFIGVGYPQSTIVLLKDGQVADTITSDPVGLFEIFLDNLSAGSYHFSLYGEDPNGLRSAFISVPATLSRDSLTTISDLLIPPTITSNLIQSTTGGALTFTGYGIPGAVIDIVITNPDGTQLHFDPISDTNGFFSFEFSTFGLLKGDYTAHAISIFQSSSSISSSILNFSIGDTEILREQGGCPIQGDINSDCSVNLVDFSIAAFWYLQPLSPEFAILEAEKLNGDGKLDLIDFSIMAFYWTG